MHGGVMRCWTQWLPEKLCRWSPTKRSPLTCRQTLASEMTVAAHKLRFFHFIICCIGTFFNAFAFSFNVIGESVKSVFALNQSQVELASSLYFVGTCLNLVPGYIYDKHGALHTARYGVIVTVVAWTSATCLCYFSGSLQGRYIIISLVFLLAGHGKSFVFFPMMVSGLNTFSQAHRGKALAVLATVYTIGPLAPVAIFKLYFSSGEDVSDKQYNLTLFVMLLGALLLSVGIMFCCSPAHKILTSSEEDDKKDKVVRYSYKELLGRADVLLFTISFALVLGTGVTFETNIPFFTESLSLSRYSVTLIVVHRVCQGLSRLVMGIIVDSIRSRQTRISIFFVLSCLSVVGLLIWTSELSRLSTMLTASICTGLARGVYGIFNIVCCENYDIVNHGKIFALADTFIALTISLEQQAFGIFYDSAMGNESGTVCHGEHCITRTGPFLSVFSLIGAGLSLLIICRPTNEDDYNRLSD